MQQMNTIKSVNNLTPAYGCIHQYGKIRVSIDLYSLNKNLKGRHYPFKNT